MLLLLLLLLLLWLWAPVLVYNGTFWRETCRFASWDGGGMAAFDRTGEEWVQKENVFIR